MTVDAMELLYNDKPDAFGISVVGRGFHGCWSCTCAPAASCLRLRRSSRRPPVRNACSRFLYLESLMSDDEVIAATEAAAVAPQVEKASTTTTASAAPVHAAPATEAPARFRLPTAPGHAPDDPAAQCGAGIAGRVRLGPRRCQSVSRSATRPRSTCATTATPRSPSCSTRRRRSSCATKELRACRCATRCCGCCMSFAGVAEAEAALEAFVQIDRQRPWLAALRESASESPHKCCAEPAWPMRSMRRTSAAMSSGSSGSTRYPQAWFPRAVHLRHPAGGAHDNRMTFSTA